MADENNTQRIARNTCFLYIRMMIVMSVSLFTSRVVLHTLGFEDFGIYNVVGSVVVFMSFLQAALRNATFRYITYTIGIRDQTQLKRIFSMAINGHILLALALFILMELGGVWFLNHNLNIDINRLQAANWVYQFSLLTFCISIVRSPLESCILAYERMDFYAITSIVEIVLKLAIVYLLTVLPMDKLVAYASLTNGVALILFLWYVAYCRRQFAYCSYIRVWDYTILRQFASYSGWSLLVNGACITRNQSINIFFNIFLGVFANAALGIANQVVSALNTFVTNFTQAFKPQLIKSWAAKDYRYFMRLIFSSSKVSYYLLLWVTIPVAVNIRFFLEGWLVDYPPMADVYIITILMYFLVDALQEPLVVAVHATGNLRFHQIMIASIVLLVIPAAYLMLCFGCSGTSVLAVNALANVLCGVARTLHMKRLIGLKLFDYLYKVILRVVLVTCLSVLIPFYLSQQLDATWTSVIGVALVSLLLTGFICFFVGFDKDEKQLLLSIPIVKKVLRKK